MPLLLGALYIGALYGFGSLAYYAGKKKQEREGK